MSVTTKVWRIVSIGKYFVEVRRDREFCKDSTFQIVFGVQVFN
jgi:hypothetical protein